MSRVPMSHRGKRPRFFPVAGMDEMVSMVIELTSEVWVLKQRLHALEHVAADQGLDLTTGIEKYQPSAEEAAALAAERQRLIAGVLRSLEAEFGEPVEGRDEMEEGRDGAATGEAERSRAA